MQKLAGKTVLITGASGGIGRHTALSFAKEKCNLALTFFEGIGVVEKIQQQCLEAGSPEVELIQLDIKDGSSIKRAVNQAVLAFGAIDVLVNCAGVVRWKRFEAQTNDDIDDQLDSNLGGVIKLTKQILPHMRSTVINIVGGAGSYPVVDLSVYCATKFGVKGFTQVLAKEYPALNFYSVSPTMTSTKMTDYHGMPAQKTADVIVQTAKDGCGNETGADIKVWQEVTEEPSGGQYV